MFYTVLESFFFTGLSVLEFCLVISICHHSEIYDQEPFNFEMIYDRYSKFASRNSTLLVTKRQVVIKAFERLSVSVIIFFIFSIITFFNYVY